MSLISNKYNTNDKCYKYLEKLRWGKKPICPYCGSEHSVASKSEKHRYFCYNYRKSYSVTVSSIFEDSRLELTKWFVIIKVMLNAKQGISAKQIQRNAAITYKTAWYCAMRIRCAMIDQCNIELENIVEMDESYVGGRKRKKCPVKPDNIPNLSNISKNKRGRGCDMAKVVGIVERHGKIVLKVVDRVTFKNMLEMLQQYVKTDDATLMTDEFKGYANMDKYIEHFVIEHQKEYVRGSIHTNTIEGFWSILKNGIRGNQRAISKKYLPFYLIGSQYIYNYRDYSGNLFEKFLKDALKTDRSDYMENYKPVKPVKELAYPKCKKKTK